LYDAITHHPRNIYYVYLYNDCCGYARMNPDHFDPKIASKIGSCCGKN